MLDSARNFFAGLFRESAVAAPLPAAFPPNVTLPSGAPLFNGNPVPVYPERGEALPVVSPEILLDCQRELVHKVRDTLPFSKPEFEALMWPILVRWAAWVHLLPASESHHHCGSGGLLRHSLEVAFYTGRMCEGLVFGLDQGAERRHQADDRYRAAAVLAGLLHDAGKPLTDVGAVDTRSTQRWTGFSGALYDWLIARGLAEYHVYWKPGERHQRHEPYGPTLATQVIGTKVLEWLDAVDPRVVARMMGAILGQNDPSNPLTEVVRRADSESTKRDLAAARERLVGSARAGAHLLAYRVVQAMQDQVRERIWAPNTLGNPVWVTDQGVFLNYPVGIRQALDRMLAEGERGVPSEPLEVVQMLVQSHLATANRQPNGAEFLTHKISITLSDGRRVDDLVAVRFDQPHFVMGGFPAPPALKVEIAQFAAAESAHAAASTSTPAAANDVASASPSAVPTAAPDPALSATTTEPAIHDRRRELSVNPGIDRPTLLAPLPDAPEAAAAWLEKQGPEGAFVRAVLDRILGGRELVWEVNVLEVDGHILIAYPECATGLGVAPDKLLELLRARKWIVADDATPDRATTTMTSRGERRGAIRLSLELSRIALVYAPRARCAANPALKAAAPAPETNHQPDDGQQAYRDYAKQLFVEHLRAQQASGNHRKLSDGEYRAAIRTCGGKHGIDITWLSRALIATPIPVLILVEDATGVRGRLKFNWRVKDVSFPKPDDFDAFIATLAPAKA
jgi:conjugal transfer pilus assembly protein TraI